MAVSLLEIDLRERTLTFRSSDGWAIRTSMPSDMFSEPSNLERVELDVESAQLAVSMAGEERAVIEFCRPGQSVEQLRARRPAVYLDQNHWSTMAAARHGHRPVRPQEKQAALRLAELAESGQILLPVSAAHLVETTPMHGAPRVALAGTVLALGRGWHMRNPLHVRVEEMLRAVQGAAVPLAAEVFAPGADRFFASLPGGQVTQSPVTALEQLLGAMPAVLGLYEAVIDEQAIHDEGGVAQMAAAGWARNFAELAAELRERNEPAEMVRRAAYANLLIDIKDDILRVALAAGVPPEAVINRLTGGDDPVASLPFLSQMRQMLFARLRNAGQGWEANDLVDIMFLCCAAAYADVVVGERRAVGYLRQAQQPAPKSRLATNLHEALTRLEEL
jgi:hypothetical protein